MSSAATLSCSFPRRCAASAPRTARNLARSTRRGDLIKLRSAETTATTTAAGASVPAPVVPAVLPGTPAPGESFPFTPEQLVEMAKAVHAGETGVQDDSVLADDFRFEFPIVKLDRETYLKTVRGFTFKQGIPNLSPNAYNFHVDKYEPNRVWFFMRTTGTHTGTFKFGGTAYEGTGKVIQGPPELCSYTFNKEGKVTSFTGGYVLDNRVGNTQGLGAAFGILAAIGVNVPKPGSLQWEIAIKLNQLMQWRSRVFGSKE